VERLANEARWPGEKATREDGTEEKGLESEAQINQR
jgi:hypothetical protein